jgi:hypothetical protein
LISKIKFLAGKLYLSRKVKSHKRITSIINYQEAKHIGLLYTLDDNKTYEAIERYVKKLQNDGKKVKACGLVKEKNESGKYLPKLSFDFINPSNLNWFGKPLGKYAEEFINETFDILIDVSEDMNYPASCILQLSKAKLKVGHSAASDIRIERKQNNLVEYLKLIDHYIKILKTK